MSEITTFEDAMSIVVVGHVDHGKSTVVGRLLAETGVLPEGKLEQIKEMCIRNSKPFEYAFLIDALKDERSQGITIDSARVFFKSKKRHYLINDAPGHIEFLKNMVTGAARAEAALLVIDAYEGIQENSRRHGYLLWMLGIKKIVILVNKMDLVDYRQDVFEDIAHQYSAFLEEVGVKPQHFIPVSGMEGDNISEESPRMPWYHGHTVLTALDEFETEPPLLDQPFRMPVQDVYKFTLYGDNRRIIAGSVASGRVKIGDDIVFYPSGKRSKVTTIEAFSAPVQIEAQSGQATGLCLEEQLYLTRGELAGLSREQAPKITSRLKASIFWLGKKPLVLGEEYTFKIHASRVKARVEKIHRLIDAGQEDFAIKQSPEGELSQIGRNMVAECTIKLNKAIAFDLSSDLKDTSRFVIIDNYEISGGGIILEDLPDAEKWVRESTFVRNFKWIRSLLSKEERAEKYNHKACLILITGEKGAGRKTLANSLEANLFHGGKIVYYLGMGSVIYGVDADITEKDREEYHHEHIRRLAEVAHIFLDAGIILIVTAAELNQDDLEIIKTVVDGNSIHTVWVGEQATTDIEFDIRVPGKQQTERSVAMIKSLLQEQGLIFSP